MYKKDMKTDRTGSPGFSSDDDSDEVTILDDTEPLRGTDGGKDQDSSSESEKISSASSDKETDSDETDSDTETGDTDSTYESESDSDSDFKPRKLKMKKSRARLVHEEWCAVCQDGGNLLLCDYCVEVYHLKCVDPPLTKVPEGKWACPKCALPELPKIDKILFWRWTEEGKKKEREFFVHFLERSYWECIWVTEFYLRVREPYRFHGYFKNSDDQVPPTLEELEWMGDSRFDENDPLTERYYRYGIKPEWLLPQRVIADKKCQGSTLYYVKWRELPYEFCSWEEEKAGVEKIHGFRLAVAKYRAFKRKGLNQSTSESTQDDFQLFEPPTKPTKHPTKHYDSQPDYLGVEGKNLKLHPYQLEGLNWLRYSWSQKVNTILGDEMGLGKTIQAISFLYSLWKEGHSTGPFLVTAPLSTVLNWEREFEAWAPDFYVVAFTGYAASRKILRQYEFTHEEARATSHATRVKGPVKFHVLLTSYQNIHIEAACLGSIDWKVIVVDEAHRLRKDSSLFFRTMITYRTKYKLLLTGTPLQNRLDELFFLLNFLEPEQFVNLEEFLCEFEDVSKEDQMKKLHEKLKRHMLRRYKADVFKDMPGKEEVIVRVEMTPFQKKYYKYILSKNFEMLKTKHGQQGLMFLYMHLLKCCNHPYLFSAAMEEHDQMYENDENKQREALVEASGKLVLLQRMLKMLKEEGRRVLVFSQMTKMLDILEDFLNYEGYEYERLDGNISGDARQNSIDRFNAPGARQFVFLLSTRAGGLGINLATSDTVIIHDSDWNPHNDVQAFSRAHRIGQKNKVMIYRFVTHNTAEEKVIETTKRKMMLNTLIVRKYFTKEEMQEIIRFGTKKLFDDKLDDNVEIHYTDDQLRQLLDRSKEDSSEQGVSNDYLNSFKLANYVELERTDNPKLENSTRVLKEKSSEYWKKLHEQQLQGESSRSAKSCREVTRKRKPTPRSDMKTGETGSSKFRSRSNDSGRSEEENTTFEINSRATSNKRNRNFKEETGTEREYTDDSYESALETNADPTFEPKPWQYGPLKKKQKLNQCDPEALKQAVNDVVTKKYLCQEAAKVHNVPFSTVYQNAQKQMTAMNLQKDKANQLHMVKETVGSSINKTSKETK